MDVVVTAVWVKNSLYRCRRAANDVPEVIVTATDFYLQSNNQQLYRKTLNIIENCIARNHYQSYALQEALIKTHII